MAFAGKDSGKVWESSFQWLGSYVCEAENPVDGLFRCLGAVGFTPITAVCAVIDSFEREPEKATCRLVGGIVSGVTGGAATPFVMAATEMIGESAESEKKREELRHASAQANRQEAMRRERISKPTELDDFFS